MNNDKPFYMSDAWLKPFEKTINNRYEMALGMENRLSHGSSLRDCANSFLYYGCTRQTVAGYSGSGRPTRQRYFIIGPFKQLEAG